MDRKIKNKSKLLEKEGIYILRKCCNNSKKIVACFNKISQYYENQILLFKVAY